MITLTAKINLLSGNNSALLLGSEDLSGNNISSNLRGVVGVKKNGSNPFILGASKLGDGSTFSDGVGYFIGEQLSDDNGNFLNEYEITIKGNTSRSLTIAFDTVNNRHPNKINIRQYKPIFGEKEVRVYYNYLSNNTYYFVGKIDTIEKPNNIENIQDIEIKITTIKDDEGLEFTEEEIKECSISLFEETENEIYCYLNVPHNFGYSDYYDITFIGGNELVGQDYIDDDPIFTITNLEENKDIIIEIDNWNAPKYPLVVTGIYAEVSIDIDRKNLISISRSIFDRSDLKFPSWGIISNTGNIEFNDTDGEIRDYAEKLLLESGLKCEIKLNNTLANAQERIGLFATYEWDYDNDNRVVSVSIKDDLEEWQNINVEEVSYDPRVLESKPFSWFYEHLWKLTSNRSSYVNDKGETITPKGNYNMLSIVELDEDTKSVLNNTYIQYPLLESGSLWQQWTKLCEVCQLHIYKDNNGVVVCRYNGGN